MATVSGRTNNKLFLVKTRDTNEPYKTGVNGVTSVVNVNNDLIKVSYTLDDIDYVTFTENLSQKEIYSTKNLIPIEVGEIVKNKKITNSNRVAGVKTKEINGVNRLLKFEPNLKKGTPVKLNKFVKKKHNNIEIINRDRVRTQTNPLKISTNNITTDTLFTTKKDSFSDFIVENIIKNDKFTGLIGKPLVESSVLLERDYNSVFERHQRLSEINNISELVDYRNGYFNVIKNF